MRDNNSEHRQRKMSQTTQADALVKGAAFGKCNTGLIHIHDESLKTSIRADHYFVPLFKEAELIRGFVDVSMRVRLGSASGFNFGNQDISAAIANSSAFRDDVTRFIIVLIAVSAAMARVRPMGCAKGLIDDFVVPLRDYTKAIPVRGRSETAWHGSEIDPLI